VAGFTHASNVIAELNCNDAELGTFTRALVPLNTSAVPNFPNDAHVAFKRVPVFPFPDESATDDPDPSSNENAATNPVAAAFCVDAAAEATVRALASVRTRSCAKRSRVEARPRLIAASGTGRINLDTPKPPPDVRGQTLTSPSWIVNTKGLGPPKDRSIS
jgi:hypothetical protein